MKDYIISDHCKERMKERGIFLQQGSDVIENNTLNNTDETTGYFQAIVNFKSEGNYLVRVIVNIVKLPLVIITVYRTSKLDKYYESKI